MHSKERNSFIQRKTYETFNPKSVSSIELERTISKKRTHSIFGRNVYQIWCFLCTLRFCLAIPNTDSFWYILLVELAFHRGGILICITVVTLYASMAHSGSI